MLSAKPNGSNAYFSITQTNFDICPIKPVELFVSVFKPCWDTNGASAIAFVAIRNEAYFTKQSEYSLVLFTFGNKPNGSLSCVGGFLCGFVTIFTIFSLSNDHRKSTDEANLSY